MTLPRARRTIRAVLLACLGAALTGSAPAAAPSPRWDGALLQPAAVPEAQAQRDATVTRSRYVTIDFTALPDRAGQNAQPGSRLELGLFPDVTIVAVLERFDPNPDGVTWVGAVEGNPESRVTIVYGGGLMAASIVTAGAMYTIRPAPLAPGNTLAPIGGLHVIAEVNQAGFPPEAPPIPVEISPAEHARAAEMPQPDSAQFIDILVVYTANAVTYAGGAAAMTNLVNLGISETNTSYANSGVSQRLRLVHAAQVPYTESNSFSTNLNNLRNGAPGLDGVAGLRDTYGADLVSLAVRPAAPDACGIGYLMTSIGAGFAPFGLHVVDASCISPNYSFAHELGHNMGARHDWYVDNGVTPHTYAHGYVSSPGHWRTIMSYNNACTAQGFNCTRILYWANPGVQYQGAPMGIAGGTQANCPTGAVGNMACDADDHQTLNDTALTVANFRQSVVGPGAFGKSSPANAATGQPTAPTVSWNASAGATSYEYCYDTSNNNTCNGAWVSAGAATSVGLSGLATATTYYWQIRAVNGFASTEADSATWWSFTTVPPAPGEDLVQNGTFGAGMTGWKTFAAPSAANMISSLAGGVFSWRRVKEAAGQPPSQATIFQETGRVFAAGAPLVAEFDLGNTAGTLKIMRVLLVADAGFSDFAACTFALPPDGVMRTYQMKGHTTAPWTNATIYFYATSPATDSGNFQLTNVSLEYAAAQSNTRTDCVDPLAPASSAGAPGANLLTNADFGSGTLPPWTEFGTITGRNPMVGGVYEFIRPTSTHPAGALLQAMTPDIPAGTILTLTLQLGNTSAVRKRALVLVHDLDFSSFVACAWWMAPGAALATYTMTLGTSEIWTDPTVAIYPSTVGVEQWFRLDNVVLQTTPAATTVGTECVGPPLGPRGSGRALPPEGNDAPTLPGIPAVAGRLAPTSGDAWIEAGGGWEASASASRVSALEWLERADLRHATAARLTFESWLPSMGSRAEVEVSVDGVTWSAIQRIQPTDGWQPVEIDLGSFAGDVISIRFVLHGTAPADPDTPDIWRLRGIEVTSDP